MRRKKDCTIFLKVPFSAYKSTKAKTISPKKLIKIFRRENSSQSKTKPAKKTKNGFLRSSRMLESVKKSLLSMETYLGQVLLNFGHIRFDLIHYGGERHLKI